MALTSLLGCSTIDRAQLQPGRDDYPILPETLPVELTHTLVSEGPTLRGSSPDAPREESKAQLNYVRLRYYRDQESRLYSHDPSAQQKVRTALKVADTAWPAGLPRMCLALSGGGLRSAAVGIGILQGFASLGDHALHGFDIISGVSGGSYAASWPLAQIHAEKATALTIDDVVSDDRPYVETVETRSPNFADWASIWTAAFMYAWATPALVWQNILGGYPIVDLGGISYYVDINDTFHRPPKYRGIPRTPLSATAGITESGAAPFVILGTTAIPAKLICSTKDDPGKKLSEHAFEVTPLRLGSDEIGYSTAFRSEPYWELTGAVMASGAALDESSFGTCRGLRFLGLLTGVKIRSFVSTTTIAPDLGSQEKGAVSLRKKTLRFIDGAATDNLALYPLIKRACQTIVAVDATEDPELKFDHFTQLRRNLKDQLGMEMRVPAIDAVHSVSSDPTLARCYSGEVGASADNFACPVMRGTIGPIPYADQNLSINLIYVKLSMNRDDATSDHPKLYSPQVAAYYKNHNSRSCEIKGAKAGDISWELLCRFPQPASKRQAYPSELFRALRYLGRDLVRAAGR
jgi:predicted acylesterase/phospholipase RssA